MTDNASGQTPVRPPLTYFGGKQTLAGWIVSHMPDHDAFVEPFAGSLAVLLAKPVAVREVVNDLDGDVVNFWRQVRNHPEALADLLIATPHSRAEHAAALDRDGCDDLERARRWWIRVTQSQGQHARRSGWRWAPNATLPVPGYLAAYAKRVGPAAARLRHVTIECDDAIAVIERHDRPDAVIYCDPPYLPETINPTSPGYTHVLTVEEHERLAATLRECQGTVLLSGYPSPLYEDLYAGWDRIERTTKASTASIRLGAEQLGRTECLWSNRALRRKATLFDHIPACEVP